MVKTTVYLEDRTKARLTLAATRRHTSEAELIREAIERMLGSEPLMQRPQLGILDTGDPTFAERADERLAADMGRDGVDW